MARCVTLSELTLVARRFTYHRHNLTSDNTVETGIVCDNIAATSQANKLDHNRSLTCL